MKGYKAFKKGLVCEPTPEHRKQYAENTIFKEDKADICHSGMHFCKEPLAVLHYYAPVDDNGELTEYAEVEALDKSVTNDNEKFCTKKLKVGAKVDIAGLVKAQIEYVKENCEPLADKSSTGYRAVSSSTGDRAVSSSTGYRAVSSSTGYSAVSSSTGDRAVSSSTGSSAVSSSTGDRAVSSSTGNSAVSSSTGSSAVSSSTGYRAVSSSTGYSAVSSSTGNSAVSSSTGYSAYSEVKGKDSVALSTGFDGKARACKGSAIVICERGKWDGSTYPLIGIKSAMVDGKKIKADTWYKLVNGKFVEVNNDC